MENIPCNVINGKQTLRLGFSLLALAVVMGGCALKPEPIPLAQHQTNAQAALQQVADQRDPIQGTLTLYEAIARALRDNLDEKVRVMEVAMVNRQLDVSKMDLLPQLTANAGYEGRDKVLASSSYSVSSGIQSLETSTSQDRDRTTGDLTLSWNILDFGVSYVRAQQAADRYLMADEQRRKVVHNVTQEVRSSYWRTVSAERLLKHLDPLLERVDHAWKAVRANEVSGLQQPLESLNYQKELADMLRRLHSLRKTLVTARTELTALMNVSPGAVFALPPLDEAALRLALIEPAMSVDEMEETALTIRPEVREQRYQNRISVAASKAALLGMLPGINVNLGAHNDSNSYLMHDNWGSAGAAISWNLFKIFSGPANLELAHAQAETEKVRLEALNVAVLAQVHIALSQFHSVQQEYLAESRYFDIEKRILNQIKTRNESGRASQMDEIRASLATLLAEIRRDQAFIQVQSAVGRLYASVGFDPLPETLDSHDISAIARTLEERFNTFVRGKILETSIAPETRERETISVAEVVLPATTMPLEHSETPVQERSPKGSRMVRVATSQLPLHTQPAQRDPYILTWKADEWLTVLDESPYGWLKVKTTDGQSGWIPSYLARNL